MDLVCHDVPLLVHQSHFKGGGTNTHTGEGRIGNRELSWASEGSEPRILGGYRPEILVIIINLTNFNNQTGSAERGHTQDRFLVFFPSLRFPFYFFLSFFSCISSLQSAEGGRLRK